jgi:hypothetical protein
MARHVQFGIGVGSPSGSDAARSFLQNGALTLMMRTSDCKAGQPGAMSWVECPFMQVWSSIISAYLPFGESGAVHKGAIATFNSATLVRI